MYNYKGVVILILLSCILAYLVGSIPFALIIGKIMYQKDVREYNSRNLGATNSLITLGIKAGILVALGDIGKGTFASALPLLLSVEVDPVYVGMCAVLGHCFPIFAGFRGGKAVATTIGVLLFSLPLLSFIAIIVFFSATYIFKYVFIGSLSMAFSISISYFAMHDLHKSALFLALSILMIYLHRSNINNFIHKREMKVRF